jgi:hypothetical protein
MATATIATSVAVNVTTSIISTTNISTTPTDYTTAITNGGIASTNIANTIASWNTLSSSITAAAGKVVTLTLSTPFDMTGFQSGSCIDIETAKTAITTVGNAAVFDVGGKDRFFIVDPAVALVMSNVTLQNGNAGNGGAIYVGARGTITLSDCSFVGNTAVLAADSRYGSGGAILVYSGGTITLSDCSFNGNTAGYAGGALWFSSNTNGLLKNCSLLGTVSRDNNDIARQDTTANVTFACADGEVGTPVQMSGTEITKLPALTCAVGNCFCRNSKCVVDPTATLPCTKCQTPGACV